MTINNTIRDSLKKNFPSPTHFVLGVSGGRDSQCLLKAFPHIAIPLGHSVLAIGVNHGLRQEADSELDLAWAIARDVGIGFRRVKLNLLPGSNIQERARDMRYAALRQFNGVIVTAHHADDRAETVMFRLLRGDGLGSLAVMPEISGNIYRPMIGIWREDITKYCEYHKLKWAEDPSNQNTKYTRAKIRHDILPMLKAINPSICSRLNNLSDECFEVKNGTRI